MSIKSAIALGRNDDGTNIYSEGYQHILLLAPHGSGKGTCFVLPTLLTLQESCIVHDIKLENYELTSGYRASIGHKIFVWNPLGDKNQTNRYNPLDYLSSESERVVNDIQQITDLLIQDDSSSKTLLTALILYLSVDHTKIRSFGTIARMLQGDFIGELSSNIEKVRSTIHDFGYRNIKCFLSKSQAEQQDIINTLNNVLYPWTNPKIDYATSASDFDIASLKTHKVTIYVGLHPSEIDALKPVMQLFYNHAMQILMKAAQKLSNDINHGGVYILMDEFYSIGKLSVLTSCMPYFRGCKIKLFLISNDIYKIENVYGHYDTKSIISNCTYKIIFAANDYNNAKQISAMCLDTLSWQQIVNLPADSQIILTDHMQPISSKKAFYYENSELQKRIIAPIKVYS